MVGLEQRGKRGNKEMGIIYSLPKLWQNCFWNFFWDISMVFTIAPNDKRIWKYIGFSYSNKITFSKCLSDLKNKEKAQVLPKRRTMKEVKKGGHSNFIFIFQVFSRYFQLFFSNFHKSILIQQRGKNTRHPFLKEFHALINNLTWM